eukprot:2345760-Rhodomonas_salina.3
MHRVFEKPALSGLSRVYGARQLARPSKREQGAAVVGGHVGGVIIYYPRPSAPRKNSAHRRGVNNPVVWRGLFVCVCERERELALSFCCCGSESV